MKKIFSPFRDAFSYAAHLESADDHKRKPEIVDKLMSASSPPEDADAGYTSRLHTTLMRTRTRHLDTLLANEVSIVLDARLSKQSLDDKDQPIYAAFYDTPGARTVALWDAGKNSKPSRWSETPFDHASTMLEKLADALDEGARGTLYASRYTTLDCWTGVGLAAAVTFTSWVEAENFEKGAVEKNPALATPPKKRVVLKP